MRDLLVIFGMIVAAIAVGALLFFFGPAAFRSTVGQDIPRTISFRLMKEGQSAPTMSERANYRIQDANQLSELWGYVQATPGSVPSVDFSKEEVFAIFDGTHTTGGYRIQVDRITEENGSRIVHVLRTSPGEGCVTASAVTSPFQIIAVPKSTLPLTHVDEMVTQDCR